MALEEVSCNFRIALNFMLTKYSKMKLQAILRKLQTCKKVFFQMTRRHRSTATSSSFYNPNLDILHTFAV